MGCGLNAGRYMAKINLENHVMNEYDYKEDASKYDEEVNNYDSYSHDVLFGMGFEFVKEEEKLLDIGIGTGLSSIKFAKIGLKVYGLDISEDMLNACRIKSFTEDLKLYNILEDKIPYESNSFDHVISCGVLHFIGELSSLFSEIKRVIKKEGIFGFTISPQETGKEISQEMTSWGVPIYKHSPNYIRRLLDINGMRLLKEQRLLLKGADKVHYEILFSVMIAKYK